MNTTKYCSGCRDNFYNGQNPYGVERCWHLESAKLMTRYMLSIHTPMNIRGAYTKVKRPSCYSCKGFVLLNEIPSYAK